jgi:hypothetical protein
MGFPPLQRMKLRESGLPEATQCPGTFRLQGFAPSCRFTPPKAARVYFTPVALMGFSPSGVSPLKKPRRLISQRITLLASAPPVIGRHGIPTVGAPTARLEFASEP